MLNALWNVVVRPRPLRYHPTLSNWEFLRWWAAA